MISVNDLTTDSSKVIRHKVQSLFNSLYGEYYIIGNVISFSTKHIKYVSILLLSYEN